MAAVNVSPYSLQKHNEVMAVHQILVNLLHGGLQRSGYMV